VHFNKFYSEDEDEGIPIERRIVVTGQMRSDRSGSVRRFVKTATEVGVRAIQDHKVIEWNTCWKCRLSEGTDDM
jgi:hypothetical protein